MSAAAAAAALQRLSEVVGRPNRPVVYSPPEMVPQWQPGYAQELRDAAAAALDAGAAPGKVHKLLDDVATRDLDGLPPELLGLCLEAGLSPDTDLGGEPLLHFLLNDPCPIPLGAQLLQPAGPTQHQQQQQGQGADEAAAAAASQHVAQLQARLQRLQGNIPARPHPACGSVTLAELLRRAPQPNLQDAHGNTALHMLVACMVSKKHFPDPVVGEQQSQQAQQQSQQEQQQSQQQEQQGPAGSGAAPAQAPVQLQDNDAPRAAYAAAAFTALLRAGWHPGVRNANGYTVADLIGEGLARYEAELQELQDPEGVPQTTVALLSSKAPDRGLAQFLEGKIQGVQAAVDALLLMQALAARAEAPRKAKSAVGLVLVWLLLLAVCVWWLLGRRQR